MPRRLCGKAGCRTYVDFKTKYCEEHQGATAKEYNRTVRYQRDARETEFYNSKAWRDLRHSYMAGNPLCVRCLDDGKITQAAIADHIIEIKDDWTQRLLKDNLQGLCRACHNIKTKEEHEKRSKTF